MPTFDRSYWDTLYQENIDPWQFRTSAYEHDKYARTIAALPAQPIQRCLELGCSIGVLTRLLASRCGHVVAVDTSERALIEARQYCPDAHVDFRRMHLPDGDLGEHYDLVIASEILYYFDEPALVTLAKRLRAAAAPNAWFISVHWTGETNYPLSADDAVRICFEEASITRVHRVTEPRFRLDAGRFAP